jgi:uncharacterized damage-inducible protein DinB
MQLFDAANHILNQLSGVVEQISENDFRKPCKALHASIGQHLRHTLEFFICLEQGYEAGVINYDNRTHNKAMENDKFIALHAIRQIQNFINKNAGDKSLTLEVGYMPTSEQPVSIASNYLREVVYNIEHAVHHMAIMKIGIQEVANYIQLPSDFGIAVSTLRYRESEMAGHHS